VKQIGTFNQGTLYRSCIVLLLVDKKQSDGWLFIVGVLGRMPILSRNFKQTRLIEGNNKDDYYKDKEGHNIEAVDNGLWLQYTGDSSGMVGNYICCTCSRGHRIYDRPNKIPRDKHYLIYARH